MSIPRTATALAAMAALALVALTGCAPDDLAPAPVQTESETPIADLTPAPEEQTVDISGIVVDGDSISVTATEGGIVADIPFTLSPTEAAAQLTAAIGLDPISTTMPPGSCVGGLDKITWGGLTFYSPYTGATPGAQFYAQVDAPQTANGITIAILSGQYVGYDGSDTIAANAGAPVIDYGPGLQVLAYDVKSGTVDSGPDDFWGASAIIRDDKLESFSSPVHYYYDC